MAIHVKETAPSRVQLGPTIRLIRVDTSPHMDELSIEEIHGPLPAHQRVNIIWPNVLFDIPGHAPITERFGLTDALPDLDCRLSWRFLVQVDTNTPVIVISSHFGVRTSDCGTTADPRGAN